MRLRTTASILVLLCSWVLWEKWTFLQPGESEQRTINAVSESDTLAECRAAMPGLIQERAAVFKDRYRGPEYQILESAYGILFLEKGGKGRQHYLYMCLPSTMDPYQHPD